MSPGNAERNVSSILLQTTIDEVSLQGFGLGATMQITDSLTLDLGYSSIDGEIDKMAVRPHVKGNEVPNAPEFTANAALTFEHEFNSGNSAGLAALG